MDIGREVEGDSSPGRDMLEGGGGGFVGKHGAWELRFCEAGLR